MQTYVQPGQTLQLHGTLAENNVLVAQYANYSYYGPNPGAQLQIDQAVTNNGFIGLEGAVSEQHYVPNGSATLDNRGMLTNNGTIFATGAAFYNGPTVDPGGALLLNEGVLLNTGVIFLGEQSGPYYAYARAVPGVLEDNGYMRNTGVVVLQAFDHAYYNFKGTSPGQLNVNGVLVNDGHINAYNGNENYGGAGATINVAGTLTNRADGLITGGPDLNAGWVLDVAASGTLNNAGTLAMTFDNDLGSRLNVAGVLHNSGTLQLQAGTAADYTQPGGAVMTLTGTMVNTGLVQVDAKVHLGQYSFYGGGATLTDAGVLTNAGTLVVYGGTDDQYLGNHIQHPAGLLLDSGTLTNLAGGVITLAGAQSGYVGAGGAVLSVVDRFMNRGLVQIGSGSAAAELSVATTGTLTDTGTIVGGGTLLNAGVIGSGDSGEAAGLIAVSALLNEGSVVIEAGAKFIVGGRVTAASGSHGVFDIGAGGTLSLIGSVAATQTVLFEGNGGTLAIGDAPGFNAVLDLDQHHLTLDFLARQVTAASSSGTMLRIDFAAGTAQDYALAAPLVSGTTIVLHADGRGGTDVVFSDPATSSPPAGAASAARPSNSIVAWFIHPS